MQGSNQYQIILLVTGLNQVRWIKRREKIERLKTMKHESLGIIFLIVL